MVLATHVFDSHELSTLIDFSVYLTSVRLNVPTTKPLAKIATNNMLKTLGFFISF